LVERHLAQFVGNARTCPHGHPIPLEDGTIWQHSNAVPLVDVSIGAPAVVLEVRHEMPELLRFLSDIRIFPGVTLSVRKLERAVGLLDVEVSGALHTISVQLAGDIIVRNPAAAVQAAS
jgi:DtxR family Mn-dependent transcriptional regulator